MPIEFKNSETAKNLMRAYAGESQARNRYTIAAGIACKAGVAVIEQLFTFTADQEKEHAEIFYNYLKELNGSEISIEGSYPVNLSDSLPELLAAAARGEHHEHDTVYRSFASVAKEEGFSQIASTFEQIAAIEKVHGDRFDCFHDLMSRDMLFTSTEIDTWFCLNCGHIHQGAKAPVLCPVCKHPQGYFIRAPRAPFTE